MSDLKDSSYLEMAYGLAERAKGWASPNPYVGAVIVRGQSIIGCGYHERPGSPHAEIIALGQAGRAAKGSTLYVTLEPCVHWGRTPPCVDAVIQAAPHRVAVSAYDPNPIVFRKGIRRLREAGIDVSVGLLSERNRVLNETYIKYITSGIPFVTLKAAVSLDARIATRTFDSRWISSPQTREYVHLVRGEYDAIMVGINTVLRDDPRLTVRHPQWPRKTIIRIVLDSALRFPLRARMLSTRASGGRIIIFTSSSAASGKKDTLRNMGVDIVEVPGSPRKIDLKDVLSRLGEQGIASVLVEGGSRLITSLLEKRLADKLFLTISPRLIGGKTAPSFLEGRGVDLIKRSWRLRRATSFNIGEDILLEGYF